ncbi:MAG TPA: hypothetical protein PL033_06855 [Candidatus Brocadiia bacterium]|nr:hypothetical protein [Candidatus Brocadiia bacterium]
MPRALLFAFLAVAMSAALSGCGNPGLEAYADGRYQDSMTYFEEQAAKKDKNFAQHSCNLGSVAVAVGEYDKAWQSLYDASCVMNDYEAGNLRGLASLIGSQATRVFKGENYEKAMANCYLGIIDYIKGDYEKARIGFDRALECKQDAPEKYRTDFALAHYLKGRALQRLEGSNPNDVQMAFRLAKEWAPQNRFLNLEKNAKANLILVVDLGYAPRKVPSGLWGSVAEFEAVPYADRVAIVLVDGQNCGHTARILDFEHQALTVGDSPTDTVQTAKSILKTVALIGSFFIRDTWGRIIVFVVALVYPVEADCRQWDLLPGETQIIALRVNEGDHNVEVRFPVTGSPPQVRRVTVGDGDRLLYFRCGIIGPPTNRDEPKHEKGVNFAAVHEQPGDKK